MPLHARQEPVRAAVLYCLEHYCYEDAVFLSERLNDEVGDVESLHLLATCLYRSGRLKQARHLLSKLSPSRHAPSDLLHATICLDLNDPNSALLNLQSFLCFKESSEADVAAYYGSDAAIAFWLLGRSHRQLNNTREAARHFRSCLKFNPFLWSAFEALSSMGESVSPDECFTVSEYPPFLPPLTEECAHPSRPPPSHPHIPPTTTSTSLTTTTCSSVDTHRSENSVPLVEEKQSLLIKKPRSFAPVDTNRASYVTPDLFAEPAVGKAIASSTPVPRALAFTRGCDGEGVGVATRAGVTGGVGSAGGGCVDVGSVRMALDFGSAPKSSVGGGGGGGVDCSDVRSGVPTFGTLPQAPPSQSTAGTFTPPLGTPSQITPSPMALPAHFTRQLLTAPAPAKKRVSHNIPPPAFKFSPTPDILPCKPDGAKTTNQISPLWSHDAFVTPPQNTPESSSPVVSMETKPHQSSKVPLKSALRRSERLRKTNMAAAPSQRKVAISNLVHSNNASKFRLKSGGRDGERSPRKGSRSVLGCTPASGRGPSSSPRKSAFSFKTARSSVGRGASGEWEGGGGGGGECVTLGREGGRLAEQQALASIGALMCLLQQAGAAYQCLQSYDLVTSLRHFRSLPPRHRSSAWCLCHMARAYHMGERYKEAAKLFKEAYSMDPHRQDGMELFASCLWHLHSDVELSVIAENLLNSDPRRVEGMCAKATSLNLARDHEGAVNCLQRAMSLHPRFPYAHTLLGHEYVMLKDFEKAMSAFRTAVSLDPRHYNAWYGMAHVCFSQERYRLAEVYIRKALAVNKCSAICCTQLALIQFRQKSYVAALRLLDKATGLCHSNPIPRFHKAKVLESLGQNEEALQQLEELSHGWPKEPNIYISKGKLLKKLKRAHEAVLNFSWALDFSRHGGSSHIQEEVDEMYQVSGAEGRNGEEDFFVHHSDSDGEDEANQLQEGEDQN